MTRGHPGVAAHMSIVGKVALVLVTLLCLSSMGGAMLFAFPILVPLHWLAGRDSGSFAVGGWALLAALSVFEAGWMLAYIASNHAAAGLAVGLAAAVGVAAWFLLRAAGRPVARPSAA